VIHFIAINHETIIALNKMSHGGGVPRIILMEPRDHQFHQHFTRAFFAQKFAQSQTPSKEKMLERLSYEISVSE